MTGSLDILSYFKAKGIHIGLDSTGSNLSIRGKLSELTQRELGLLRDNKEDLISFLSNQRSVEIPRTEINKGDRLDLAPNQKGIWTHLQFAKSETMYLIPALYGFDLPGLDQQMLKEAATILVDTQKAMSFVFSENKGIPYQQVVAVNIEQHLFFKDYSMHEDKELRLQQFIVSSMEKGFDLTENPPWNITVFEFGNNHYRFFLKTHHLVTDGAALGLMVKGLIECYQALYYGRNYVYEGVQYHDYLKWITDRSQHRQSSKFWKSYLENYPEDFAFITLPKVTTPSDTPVVGERIESSLKENINAFTLRHSIGLSHLFIFAFGLVLSKYGRTNDLIIGTPVEGRTIKGLSELIGDLVNPLPIRITLNYTQSIIDNLNSLKSGFVDILQHQMYPFDYILEDIQYQRKADRFPLFNSMISIPNNQEISVQNENDWKLERRDALYDLTLTVLQPENEIELELEFDPNKIHQKLAKNLLDQTLTVIDQITCHPESPLSTVRLLYKNHKPNELALTTEKRRERNQPDVLTTFREQVSLKRNSVAVKQQNEEFSYEWVYEHAEKIASTLQKQGVGHSDCVAVELNCSHAMICSMLGIWMAGAVYVPLGSNLPISRKDEILDDCCAKVIINQGFLDALSNDTHEHITPKADDLAYLLYTSGSTGRPKGVMISHGALACKMEDEKQLLKLESIDTLTLTSPTFDVSFLEILLPLICGGKVVIWSEGSIQELHSLMYHENVTVIQGTPTFFSHFESELKTNSPLNDTLKLLCIGGESLNNALVTRLKTKLPKVQINNHYGPTETTIDAIVKENVISFDVNSLGSPFGATDVFIRDEYGNDLPEFVPGELIISGPSIGSGYWNLPEQTKNCFILSTDESPNQYKTGDLVAWLENGEVQYIGRKDHQVKFRGFRIELEEINARVRELSGISDAYTKVLNNSLVCWVVAQNISGYQIMDELEQFLPDYMIPTVYQNVSFLPMNANGKVDEKQLPFPQNMETEFFAPRDEREAKLAEIWQDLLKIEQVGIYQNFFELGGNSLNLMQLRNSYESEFGYRLELKQMLRAGTIASHLELFESAEKSDLIKIETLPESESYPLSFSQSRLWLLSQMEKGSTAYNMPALIRLKGNLDVDRFNEAVKSIVAKYEILRTVFVIDHDGEPRQKIIPISDLDFSVNFSDLSSQEATDKVVAEKTNELLKHAFDLENGPLLNVSLFQLNASEYVLFYSIHHIVSDGWSLELLMNEILEAYYKVSSRKEALPFQYKDFAQWQRDQITKEPHQKDFWINLFRDEVPVLNLPLKDKRPAVKTFNGAVHNFAIDSKIVSDLKKFCGKQQGTLFTGLFAVLNGLLYRYCNQTDIVIGSPVSGRTRADLENQIGLFVNTLPIRSVFNSENNFDELFEIVANVISRAYDNQMYPFDLLVNELKLTREISRNPLFDVMLVLQNFEQRSEQLTSQSELEFSYEEYQHTSSQFDLTFVFQEWGEQLTVSLEYNTDLFEQEFIETLAEHFVRLLAGCLDHKEQAISEIPLLSKEEEDELLALGSSKKEIPELKSALELFMKNARIYGQKCAVKVDSIEYSYSELSSTIGRVAHYLSQQGVVKGECVGVITEKSLFQVASMYAIWYIDATYVPIDNALPNQRKAQIIENAGIKLLLQRTDIDNTILEEYDAHLISKTNQSLTNPAYILYTSGTSGKPKGAVITHLNLAAKLIEESDLISIDENTTTFALTSAGFDVSFLETVLPLSFGGTVVFPTKESLGEPKELIKSIDKNCVTHLQGTPTFIHHLVSNFTSNDKNVWSELRFLCIGGESLNEALVDQLRKQLPHVQINNHYGPTETTIDAIVHEKIERFGQNIIGRPLPFTQAYVVDYKGNLVPKGVVGELIIGGPSVFDGYKKNEELTRECKKSFGEKKGEFYYTGDLVRQQSNGNIIYISRKDRQVKLRGYRIEPDDISNTILSLEGMRQAYCKVEGKLLLAWVVGELNVFGIQEELRNRLPEYMIPHSIQIEESLPITLNGKIDEKRLPDHQQVDSAFALPESELELKLAEIWCELLDISQVGVIENLFELGGHSITIMQLHNRYREIWQKEINIIDLFTSPTIKGHVRLLIEQTLIKDVGTLSRCRETKSPGALFQQRNFVHFNASKAAKSAFNVQNIVSITGEYTQHHFELAIKRLIGKHEILRTKFFQENGTVIQVVLSDWSNDVLTFYNKSVIAQESQDFLSNKMNEIMGHAFELDDAPLIRFYVAELTKSHFLLCYIVPHIIFDEHSDGILQKDFIKALSGELPPASFNFRDYSLWEREYMRSSKYEKMESFWKRYLSDAPSYITLPYDHVKTSERKYDGAGSSFVLSQDQYNSVKVFARENRVSVFSFFTAIWSLTLSQISDSQSIVMRFPVSLREHSEFENVIGPMINTTVFSVQIDPYEHFEQLIERTFNDLLSILQYKMYPFDKILTEANTDHSVSTNEMYNVALRYSPIRSEYQQDSDRNDDDAYSGKYDYLLNVLEYTDAILIDLEYNRSYFNPEHFQKLKRIFQELLELSTSQNLTRLRVEELLSQSNTLT